MFELFLCRQGYCDTQLLWSHNLLNIHPRKILNTDLILKSGIFQKALARSVHVKGIFPGVKTIVKF
jgi:hypothetical protein